MSDHIESGVHRGSRPITLGALLLAALAASCSDTAPTHPTVFISTNSSVRAVTIGTTATTVIAQPVSNFICPVVSPFFVPITVVVNPNGRTGVVVTQIQLQFTDSTRQSAPIITLPGPVPITQFGDALEASRNALAFPLTLGIGCGVGTTGTVLVIVNGHDGTGMPVNGQVSVNVSR